ncbi:MAG: outer membrane beta-barrel protein [Croceivirga sp.]
MMKKTLLMVAVFFTSYGIYAQAGSGFGIKAGLNYTGNGEYFDSVENARENTDRNAGFHIGVYGKLGNRIYVRPELVYTSTTSGYDEGDLKLQKLDVPVLVGAKIIGPLHGFIGPSFLYILNSKFADVTIDNIENDFTVGLNLGVGVNLGKFGVDLRYERGLSSNEISLIESNLNFPDVDDRVDTRPDQLILSFSVKI